MLRSSAVRLGRFANPARACTHLTVAHGAVSRSANVGARGLIAPYRRAASSTTGAPFTNSISFAPTRGSNLNEYTVEVRMPDAQFDVNVFGRDSLEQLRNELEQKFVHASTGGGAAASRVALLVNGRRLDASELAERRISGLFGCALDVEVNGVRWNVNEGFRLSEVGRVAKRSLVRGYIYLAVGGALVFVAALETWRFIVPKEKQRIY